MTAPAISPPLAPPATLKKLAKLGITTAADVILHLPLRYEDETHLVSIADAQYGHSVQIEGVVSQVNVQYQPRKRLMVQLEQGGHSIWLRFIHFYPSQQTTCAVGNRLRVVGELRHDLDVLHAYRACMNMGTLSGAPKVRAMQLIAAAEGRRRGSYGGAVGYFTAHGDLDTCIVIRSAYVEDGIATVQAGAGIVLDSVPQSEADETRSKARAVLRAIATAHHAQEIF